MQNSAKGVARWRGEGGHFASAKASATAPDTGKVIGYVACSRPLLGARVMDPVESFLKYDYAETKDLLKTFITLISATLVLSLTFSDKVIKYDQAQPNIRRTMLLSWTLLVLALISTGLGLAFIAAAAGKMLYGGIPLVDLSVASLALTSWSFVLGAGGAYVAGLIAMIFSAARSMTPR